MAWAMQTRQANKAKQIINSYVDQNPDKVLSLIQDPMVVKLSEKYTAPIENKYIDLLSDTGLEEDVIQNIAKKMAFQHIKGINSISSKDKLEVIGRAETGMLNKPIYGDRELRRLSNLVVKKQSDYLKKVFKDELGKLEDGLDDETINKLLIRVEKAFIGKGASSEITENMVTDAFTNLIQSYRDLLIYLTHL